MERINLAAAMTKRGLFLMEKSTITRIYAHTLRHVVTPTDPKLIQKRFFTSMKNGELISFRISKVITESRSGTQRVNSCCSFATA